MHHISHIPANECPNQFSTLIEMRATAYRNYPYLYEQNLDDERDYVVQYLNQDTQWIVVKKDAKILGMVIGLPLSLAQDWIREAFANYPGDLNNVFYVGELLASDGKEDLKKTLLIELESRLQTEKKFGVIAVCEVYREECPEENEALDTYWAANGYQKHEELKSVFWWKDSDKEQKTPKTLVYWLKNLF